MVGYGRRPFHSDFFPVRYKRKREKCRAEARFSVECWHNGGMADEGETPTNENEGAFRQTRWSLVARAASGDETISRAALEEVCQDYWYPLYAFARRKGIYPADAEDLVQGFFHSLLEDGLLANANQSRGRLRTFLIAVFSHQLTDEARRRNARKRGGDAKIVSLDRAWAEGRFAVEPVDEAPDAGRAHDRRWALLMLEGTMARLTRERADAGRASEVQELAAFLSFEGGGQGSYESAARELGWTVNATRVAVFRLRRRFRELLLTAIADTLEDPSSEAIDAEIRELIAALG